MRTSWITLVAVWAAVVSHATAQAGEIHEAAKTGDSAKVKQLLEDNPDLVNEKVRDGSRPLHWAAANGHREVVELLLKNGADVNAMVAGSGNIIGEWYWRFTPLHWAALCGHREVAEMLLAHKADVNNKAIWNLTALHLAVIATNDTMVKRLHGRAFGLMGTQFRTGDKKGMVELLLAHKPDVNAIPFSSWSTPLGLAAAAGHTKIVKLMLAQQADVNRKGSAITTALHEAATAGKKDVVELLLSDNADVIALDTGGRGALLSAAKNGHIAVVELLLQAHKVRVGTKGSNWAMPLREAVLSGKKEIVELVLAHGARANVSILINEGEGTALHMAAEHDYYDIAELLLANKADVNAMGWVRRTPLHLAAEKGFYSIVELLLAYKADIAAKDKNGGTPLHLAAMTDDRRVVELLLRHGANVEGNNQCSSTPLHMAAWYGQREVAEVLLAQRANINARDGKGRTPLHVAVYQCKPEVVRVLLTNKAEVNAKDSAGNTPLHLVDDGRHWWYMADRCKKVAELLLASKAEINATNNEGYTPLHVAAGGGSWIMTELLVANKAEPNVKAKDGSTPLDLAVKNHWGLNEGHLRSHGGKSGKE